jgi:hypothetical protein
VIKKNLGRAERAVRFVGGVVLGFWVTTRSHFGLIEWLALIAAVFLVFNSFFARCYLWHLLGLDTCRDEKNRCPDSKCDNADRV